MLTITPTLALDERELEEKFVHASGPGGQNVNKVATAVQLRFDVTHTAALPAPVKDRLRVLAAPYLTAEGVLLLEGRRFRTQEQNRQDVRQRLVTLIRQALVPPKPRRPTRVSRAAKARRVEAKQQRGQTKRLRRPPPLPKDE